MRYDREANLTVNVLLRELEAFNGIVIFATNLAANFDPAFERRIRTHVLFDMPGVEERERIWQLQIHPKKTPLGPDVNFRQLAERYEVSGGDIKNAVLKAAAVAAAQPGPDLGKRITQQHFETAAEEVLAAKAIMQQSLFTDDRAAADRGQIRRKLETPYRTLLLLALGVAGAALTIALAALGLVLLR
jgi:ATP-dependent Zn protease